MRKTISLHRVGRLVLVAAGVCAIGGAIALAAPPTPFQIMGFLSQTVDWYRQTDVETHIADQPSDVLFVYDDRGLANQVVSLSFAYGRAQAQQLALQNVNTAAPDDSANESRVQNLTRLLQQANAQVTREQDEIQELRAKLANSTGNTRAIVQSQLNEEESELQLVQERSETLKDVLQFSVGTTNGKTRNNDLISQIAALEQTVPAARTTNVNSAVQSATAEETKAQQNSLPAVAVPAAKPAPSGILGLSSSILDLRSKMHSLDDEIAATNQLTASARALMAPIGQSLAETAKQSDQLTTQPDSNDLKVNAARKAQMDTLAAQFRQNSTVFLPLVKEVFLLNRYQASLASWRGTMSSEQRSELKSLAVRLIFLGVALAIAAAISALWGRLTSHYITDIRRRSQFLLLRRIVMFTVFAIIIALSFSTDLGSLTTFAGLLGAGIVLCLQNVILSAVGYFVLLGKYRVHTGDRIEIAGVVGNVVDIDLMRLSLMEVGQRGTDAEGVPTGRTVEFPNAIVFQPTAGFFKQVPGINYLWHEIAITLTGRADYHSIEDRIMNEVNGVFRDYSDKMEQQHERMERALNFSIAPPKPLSRLRFTQSGLEIIVRYPVTRDNAIEIDDRITRALLGVMEYEPTLKSVGVPTPDSAPDTKQSAQATAGGKAVTK